MKKNILNFVLGCFIGLLVGCGIVAVIMIINNQKIKNYEEEILKLRYKIEVRDNNLKHKEDQINDLEKVKDQNSEKEMDEKKEISNISDEDTSVVQTKSQENNDIANKAEETKIEKNKINEDNTPSVEEKSTVTLGKKNALSSAKSYLSIMSFSYSGLVKQLEYEGYSNEEAIYAADNCGADWNEQAARCAQSYIDTMAFSRTELIRQLEYEGFTNTQAEYGVSAIGY